MKTFTLSVSVLILFFLIISGCKGGKEQSNNGAAKEAVILQLPEPVIGKETLLLLEELEVSGDYVNSREFPSLIRASIVNEGTGGKNLVIDLREPADYREGHIKGSVNKRFSDLPSWFETGIRPFEYEKIILVCDDGQLSSYTTALLRLKGYGNVFAMRWGMSGWNRKYAEKGWLSGLSGEFESVLDTVTHQKPAPSAMPVLATGFNTGKEISDARFTALFREGTDSVLISAARVFRNPSGYFIINLERKDKYQDGHIQGAVRYKPDETLGFKDVMSTIPFDKPVVIYCGSGHNSAFATAFLRLFGYDARTLKYGNNGFMHDRMVKQKAVLSWLPFTEADINNFDVVK